MNSFKHADFSRCFNFLAIDCIVLSGILSFLDARRDITGRGEGFVANRRISKGNYDSNS